MMDIEYESEVMTFLNGIVETRNMIEKGFDNRCFGDGGRGLRNLYSQFEKLESMLYYIDFAYGSEAYDKAMTILDEMIPMACPREGSFIGYKKALDFFSNPVIVTLEIPSHAKRCGGMSVRNLGKCRCDKAKVIEITDLRTGKQVNIARSASFVSFKYKVGCIVESDSFDTNRFHTCSNGIHFFMDIEQAKNY